MVGIQNLIKNDRNAVINPVDNITFASLCYKVRAEILRGLGLICIQGLAIIYARTDDDTHFESMITFVRDKLRQNSAHNINTMMDPRKNDIELTLKIVHEKAKQR